MSTSADVHLAIQQMDNGRPRHDRAIEINSIEASCHMNASDMGIHIAILLQLNYLDFADFAKKKIMLTESGQWTLVPHIVTA